jgi:hypothetical protein
MIEVLKQAYQLLLTEPHAPTVCNQLEVIFRQAIAELESQEPKCEWCDGTGIVDSGGTQPWGEAINIPCRCQHTHPPQRTWVGLTDYEIGVCSTEAAMNRSEMVGGAVTFARAIEAKLKQLNT